ncbi:MAG: DUF4307 domain-containing protein [Microbacterium sp.]|nr:MAG: DUF4307 domain-containing protein [Microbacterium sp.]
MTSSDTTALLDDRYGRTRSRGRFLGWAVIGAAALALLVYVAWSTIAQSANSVDVDTTGYSHVDERTVSIDFQVTAAPGTTFVCALEAQDEEHGVVGWRVVEYPGSSERTRRLTEEIPTTAPATTGFVTSCWIP